MSFPDNDPQHLSSDASSEFAEPRLLTRRDIFPTPPQEHPRRALFAASLRHRARFHAKGIFLTAGILLALIAFTLITTALWLRHTMHASLAQLDGALHAPGLTLPVTVTRDAQGVPDIQAANLDDLLFAQGFITAQDRLWQMDAIRRHVSGRLAEILGSTMSDHDRLQRTLQLSEAADNAVAILPADQLHQLQAYSRGVNAFIALASKANTLPVEFHVLHYTPAPWEPRDSILVSLAIFQDLSTGFPTKLRREALAQHLPASLLADLYPVGSWRDRPPTQPLPDLTIPVPEIEQIPLDRTQSSLQPANPQDILGLARQLPGHECSDCRAGSNNWAIAASHSASGAPLVSNDMHLSLSMPDIWYETALHATATSNSPALDVTGFTLPGVPFVIVGRNQHVAWGFTNLMGDVQDVRVEHLRGQGEHLEYQRPDNTWAPVGHHNEHIVVRGGRNIDLDVLTTTEHFGPSTMASRAAGTPEIATPIISPLLQTEHRALSLAWTLYDPANITSPFLAVNTATDGASLAAAFSTFGGPALNLIYADDHNHIGYHAIGAIPVRGPANQNLRTLAAPVPTGPAPSDEEDQINASDETESDEQAQTPSIQPPPTALPPGKTAFGYSIGSPISPVPIDSLDATQIWSGYIPYDQLPNIIDPSNGFLATANSRIAPDNYPYAIALNWVAPYRTERINKLLAGRNNLTPGDLLALQNDTHSEFDLVVAQRLSYALDHASKPALAHDTNRLHQAADILRAWNGDVSPNAAAPTIVTATRNELWAMLLTPQLAAHDKKKKSPPHLQELLALYDWGGSSVALESLLQHTPARWLPAGYATWNDLLTAAVVRALRNAPSNVSTWRFGPTHPIEIDHPVFSNLRLFDLLLGVHSGTGPQITGGDGTTIKAIATHFGPSERFTADLANPQSTVGNITTGQSGNPSSPHYLDQFQPWLNGATFPLPLTPTQQTHTLTLLP